MLLRTREGARPDSRSYCRRLLFANDPQKMLCFIQFTFDPELLRELCRDEWLKIYDSEYVDALILQASGEDRPGRQGLLAALTFA